MDPVSPTAINTPNILGVYFVCGCTSPCLDAGLNSYVPSGITLDVRGSSRIVDGNNSGISDVDLGAYEFNPNGCTAIPPPSSDGTSGNPFEISMLQHLYWIAIDNTRWDKHYKQTANIDACNTSTWFGGSGWLPIGNSSVRFIGTYNGQGYTIANLTINRSGSNEIGFFGETGGKSTAIVFIKNLTLTNLNIAGKDQVGGLVGRTYQHLIIGIFNVRIPMELKVYGELKAPLTVDIHF